MLKYPDSWLCTCGHEQKDHIPFTENYYHSCKVRAENGFSWADGCCKFVPVDNLTLVEKLTNA